MSLEACALLSFSSKNSGQWACSLNVFRGLGAGHRLVARDPIIRVLLRIGRCVGLPVHIPLLASCNASVHGVFQCSYRLRRMLGSRMALMEAPREAMTKLGPIAHGGFEQRFLDVARHGAPDIDSCLA